MKIKFLATFLFIIILTGSLFALDRSRKIEPVTDDLHLVLTKSLYNQTQGMDEATRRMIYVAYIAGFVDAMQLETTDTGAAKKFLDDCQGMTLGDLIDMMIKFKDENSQFRNVSPAVALTVVIPRLKKGLAPFPEK
ncbi:MAG: hypothetical protein PHP10_00380 [Candidatus Omnitrophica bacterium]|nr:hypothetical protein [Candidatus Omnitrophota bacterium]